MTSLQVARTSRWFRIALLLALAASSRSSLAETAAAPPAVPPACGCADELDALVAKVEANYVGYHLSLPTMDRVGYESAKRELRARAAAATDETCFLTLREYVERFHDPHLFLSEQPEPGEAEAARLEAAAESLPWDEAKVRAYLDRNAGKLDPVEGIWYSDTARFGVVRDVSGKGRDFVAVLLTEGAPHWKAGQVKAELTKQADGNYEVRYYYGNHTLHHLRGELYKRVLLRMAPAFWGRAYPLRPEDAGVLDATNPRNPTLRVLDRGVVVVSMPSHDGPYHDPLEQLVAANLAALEAAPWLIIDVRGDEGGGAQTSAPLEPFYTSERKRPRPQYEGKEVVVASADLVSYYEKLLKAQQPGSIYETRFTDLVARMRREPGKVIATDIWGGVPEARPTPRPAGKRPRKVAILLDRGTVSAGEAFILSAWVNEGVTLYGERSGGSIDYQSVSMVPLACTTHALWVGYPTMGGSDRLPAGGFNATGIVPDVPIPPGEADPIRFVVEHELGPAKP
jgi:hypothetical protein